MPVVCFSKTTLISICVNQQRYNQSFDLHLTAVDGFVLHTGRQVDKNRNAVLRKREFLNCLQCDSVLY